LSRRQEQEDEDRRLQSVRLRRSSDPGSVILDDGGEDVNDFARNRRRRRTRSLTDAEHHGMDDNESWMGNTYNTMTSLDSDVYSLSREREEEEEDEVETEVEDINHDTITSLREGENSTNLDTCRKFRYIIGVFISISRLNWVVLILAYIS
jgi:hypothetical protein